jgi:hypothetical protein
MPYYITSFLNVTVTLEFIYKGCSVFMLSSHGGIVVNVLDTGPKGRGVKPG